MALYIGVVSHGHGNIIKELNIVNDLSFSHTVVVKSNKKDPCLNEYLEKGSSILIDSNYGKGFGSNNNEIFDYCVNVLNMKDDDHFLVLNPDVSITKDQLDSLLQLLISNNISLGTIDLYNDFEFTIRDNSVRKFPKLIDFISSFVLGINNTIIDRTEISSKEIGKAHKFDWAAGSFLVFTASHYKQLRGFDEDYFMYCEDIDICLRSKNLGEGLHYLPDVRAVHLSANASRNIFSKNFLWHIKSIVRYLYISMRL
ncbi:A-D-glcNAc-diphosphoryl polyprenol [Vibrio ishigakensis]|uniref:A-D-glcNAc-diphosphoryl polyprenol n=1 Tax=Vibrio ishigakensis TaxID=1481914 RepID=A0A0B8PAE7_9VIBR|nr:A-D-glcNAc-diphosphoryl polyprenol [Vibrio ishigakensis]